MKDETDSTTVGDKAKEALPKREGIVSVGNWDDRIAQARARREQALAQKNSKTGDKQGEAAPEIEDILATTNWTDRLAKAKLHRDQVLADRASTNSAAADKGPGGLPPPDKDTVRTAVAGLPFKHTQVATESKPAAKNTTAALVFPPIAMPEEEPKKRFGIVAVAAGIVLALGLGMFLPNPFRGGISIATDVSNTPVPATTVATVSTEPSNTAIADTPTEKLLAPPELTDLVAGMSVGAAEVTDNIGAVASDTGAVSRVSIITFAKSPMIEVTPVIDSQTFVNISLENKVANSADVPTFKIPPDLSVSVTPPKTPVVAPSLATYRVQRTDSIRSSSTQQQLPTLIVPRGLPIPEKGLKNATANSILASTDIANLRASIEANSTTFLIRDDGTSSSVSLVLGVGADPGVQLKNITFLSGPSNERPLNLPLPITQLKVAPVPAGFTLPIEVQIQSPRNGSIARTNEAPARLASIGAIPLTALPADPAIIPEQPEAFELLNARLGKIQAQDEQIARFPGAEAFTIHLRAPSSLTKQKLDAFAHALQSTGLSIGEPKRVNFKISKNNVRYFHKSDAEAARILAEAVEANARDFTDYLPSPPIGTIEVWLAGETVIAKSRRPSRRPAANDQLNTLRNRLLQSLRRGDHL